MSALPLPAAPASTPVQPPALPGGLSLPVGRTAIMGILNVTPDSISDGGRYTDVAAALRHAREMVAAGADLIDVGGESTRPNSTRISADEEWRWDPEMNAVVAQSGCAYVVQHYRALPGMPGEHFDYGDDLVGTLIERVGSQVQDAIDAGVTADKIVVDPGLGFSLTGDQCWQILRELPRFAQVGYPVLVGASRKRFVKALEGDVDANSADIAAYCAAAGAWAVRVHDVAATVAAIARKENDVD